MTLTLTLKGTGSLDDVVAPDLAKLPKVNEAFKVYEPTREQKGRQCVFTYTIRPKKAGAEQFPAIAASYYDVNDSKYVTLNTKPIPVDITKADRLSQGRYPFRRSDYQRGFSRTPS